MKFSIIALLCLVNLTLFSQAKYTEEYKLFEDKVMHIGDTKDFSIYSSVVISASGQPSGMRYVKVPVDGGEPVLVKMGKFKHEKLLLSLRESCLYGDVLIEAYMAKNPYVSSGKGKVYILKRDINTFSVIGEPILVEGSANSYGTINLDIDKEGLFLRLEDNEETCFLQRYDFDLNLLWSKDITILDNDGNKRAPWGDFIEEEKAIIFSVDLSSCSNCDKGFFKKEKKITSSIIGFFIYNSNGEKKSFIPEIPNGVIYSSMSPFLDSEKGTVTCVFSIHEAGEDEYHQANGSGYLFCEWNDETGELLNSESKVFTYADVITDEAVDFISIVSPKAEIELEKRYPMFRGKVFVERLTSGDYLYYTYSCAGQASDLYNSSFNSELLFSNFIVCLSPEGEMKWTKFIPLFREQHTYPFNFSSDMKLNFLSLGKELNYPRGDFKLSSVKGGNSLFIYYEMDLTSGETTARSSFGLSKKKEYNKGYTKYNKVANKLVVAIQSNSGVNGQARKTKFTIVDL